MEFTKRRPSFSATNRAAETARDVADVIEGMKSRAAPYAGPRSNVERDPAALAEALDALRIQHEELLVADEELRAQLEELTRVDDVIARERARTQAVFGLAPDAYLITDLNVAVVECNLAAISLFGRDADEIIRRPLAVMIAQSDISALYAMAAAARDGQKQDVALRVRQRGQHAAVATKAIVTKMGADSLFWRFRLVDDAEIVTYTAPPSPADATARPMGDSLRVLVLSHDPAIVSTFEAAAKSFNGAVEHAPNIRSAVALLETFPADVVVADLWSEGHLKHDIIAELRLHGPRPMPLGIALSGVSSADSTYALKAGFHAFLLKPVSYESAQSALKTVTRVLLKRSMRRARTPSVKGST